MAVLGKTTGKRKQRLLKLQTDGFFLVENEEIRETATVAVWKFTNLWLLFLIFVVFILVYDQLLSTYLSLVALLVILVFSWFYVRYFVRQYWRMILTNKRIIARQKFPKFIDVAVQRVYSFPLDTIEGLSIGPRTYESIFLIGLFTFSNIGVNLLKNGLSLRGVQEYDPPDQIEFFILLLRQSGLKFLVNFGDQVNHLFQRASVFIGELQIRLGIAFSIVGLVVVLLTFPRRHYMGIRVRHGRDFILRGGFPGKFWQQAYRELYKTKIVDAPPDFQRLDFPWLQDEQVEEIVDLEQTFVINRIIAVFAIIAGTIRLWRISTTPGLIQNQTIVFWIIIAFVDLFLAYLGIKYSRKKNEMIITNKRILFALEEVQISGAVGKRLYFVSDLKRNDIAGFEFDRIRGFSSFYLILGSLIIGLSIYFFIQLRALAMVITLILGLLALSYVNQTYVGFTLKTKGGELWRMRHQLVNPLTRVREFLGDENIFIRLVLINRLEEKEVVSAVHHIRSQDLHLEPVIIRDNHKPDRHITINVKQLLLKDEPIIFQQSVPRSIPKRRQVLLTASLLYIGISFYAIFMLVQISQLTLFAKSQLSVIWGLLIFVLLFNFISLWIIYYSIKKAIIYVTPKRVFFEERVHPPIFLYYLGIFERSLISETLRSQLHSTYTRRQRNQLEYARKFVIYFLSTVFFVIVAELLFLVLKETGKVVFFTTGEAILLIFALICLAAWFMFVSSVEFAKMMPKRATQAKGVSVNFQIPFLNSVNFAELNSVLWEEEPLVNSGGM